VFASFPARQMNATLQSQLLDLDSLAELALKLERRIGPLLDSDAKELNQAALLLARAANIRKTLLHLARDPHTTASSRRPAEPIRQYGNPEPTAEAADEPSQNVVVRDLPESLITAAPALDNASAAIVAAPSAAAESALTTPDTTQPRRKPTSNPLSTHPLAAIPFFSQALIQNLRPEFIPPGFNPC
jgi:hypothetical protein